jgi:hypothetical protein
MTRGTSSSAEVPAEFVPVLERLSPDERDVVVRLASMLDLGTLNRLAITLRPLELDAQAMMVRKIIRDYQNKQISIAQRAVFGALSDADDSSGNGG